MDDRQIGESVAERSRTDIAIIGGGIAGLSTAFYILHETDSNVTVLERDKVGYGASGRNGGQGIASVERSFKDLLSSLDGVEIARMLNDLESGYKMIDDVCQELDYHSGLFKTTVWTGLSSISEVQKYIEDMNLREKYGAPVRPLFIEEKSFKKVHIYADLVEMISTKPCLELKKLLHTKEEYLAAYPTPVSLANSGLLSRAIARYLLKRFPNRFVLHEESPVSKLVFTNEAIVHVRNFTITARVAILCTNGYPLPKFESDKTPKVTETLHRYVASMVAHISDEKQVPGAFIYYHEEGDPSEEPYFYLTRRPFLLNGKDLVTVGGPQQSISKELDHREEYPERVYERIDSFLTRSYPEELPDKDMMCWNGPMGYTEDGLRMIGPDPNVPALWYNMACNGVGFLHSIVGGKMVAAQLKGLDL